MQQQNLSLTSLSIAVFLFSVALFFGTTYSKTTIKLPIPGEADLQQWNFVEQGEVSLKGDWRSTPNADQSGNDEQLRVSLPTNQNKTLAIHLPYIFSHYELQIDGKVVSNSGLFREDKKIEWKPRVILFEPQGPETVFRLLTHGGNYFIDGLSGPLTIGLPEQIQNFNNKAFIKESLYFGIFLLIGIFHFAFIREKDKAPLWMGIYCIQIAIYIITYPERNLLSVFDFDWEATMKVQMIGLFTCLLTFHLFLQETHPCAMSKRFGYLLTISTIVSVVTILVTTSDFYSNIFLYVFGPSLVLVCTNVIVQFALNAIKRNQYATFNLIGFSVLACTAINDFLNNAGITKNPFLVAEGLLFYLTVQALIVKHRYQEAFNQSERLNREMINAYEAIERNVEEITKARDDADRALASKSYFMALISHEIRNPITAVYQTLESLEMQRLGPVTHKTVSLALDGMEPLFNLLNDIIDFSTIEYKRALRITQQTFDIDTLFRSSVLSYEHSAAEKNIVLHLRSLHKDSPIRVVSDPTRIRQLLVNLVTNAIKYTPPGGEIVIKYEVRRPEVEQGSNHELIFQVSDTGVGIPADKHEEIFEVMRQLSNNDIETRFHGGFGLGLAICKHIASQMNGSIEVASEIGAGSTFTVRMPVKRSEIENESAQTSFQRIGGHILLVEDDPSIRSSTGALLQNAGITFETAENAEAALAILQKRKFDLIFLDCYLPGISGFQLAQKIRTHEEVSGKKRTPIVGLSASPQTEVIDKVFESGMDDFMSKPYKKYDLYQKVICQMELEQDVAKYANYQI